MQQSHGFSLRSLLVSSALGLLMAGTAPGIAHAAFDPDAGQEPISLSARGARQPAPIYSLAEAGSPSPIAPAAASAPLYPERVAVVVPATPPAPPAPPANAQALPAIPSAPAVSSPAAKPVVPAPTPTAQVSGSEPSALSAGYIAPPPALAALPAAREKPPAAMAPPAPPAAQKAPVVAPAPQTVKKIVQKASVPLEVSPHVVAAAPEPTGSVTASPPASPALSPEERAILSRIPDTLEKPPVGPTRRASIQRMSPEVAAMLPKLEKDAHYESTGIKISVSRPRLDTPYELTRAYDALMVGDSEGAVEIYQSVLAIEPRNQDALFGLAATYQRAGETDKARLLYVELLKINPQHREALNNFLMILSQENPQAALYEMQKLAQRNPDFSPLIAQIAMLYEKLGEHALARREMLRAIQLSPENLVYKYNLAVMLDRQNQSADAIALYQLLIDASLRGEAIPVPIAGIQERMTYLQTASSEITRES